MRVARRINYDPGGAVSRALDHSNQFAFKIRFAKINRKAESPPMRDTNPLYISQGFVSIYVRLANSQHI